MSITYPLSHPTTVLPRRMGFTMNNVVGMSASPFSGAQQVYAHAGQFWSAEVQLPPMLRADAEAWIGFLAALRGRYGTFLMGDPANTSPRGIATGTPLVQGGSQLGNALATDGWTAGVTGILKAGDWIQLGSGASAALHKIMQDVNSDGSGYAALDLWPAIRSAPADNAAITITNCKGLWRLAENQQGWDLDIAQFYGLSFSCLEAF